MICLSIFFFIMNEMEGSFLLSKINISKHSRKINILSVCFFFSFSISLFLLLFHFLLLFLL